MVFLVDQKFKELDGRLGLGGCLEGVKHATAIRCEALGVFRILILKVVFNFGGEVDADVGLIGWDTLVVVIGGCCSEGGRELVNIEGGDLGETRGILLAALRKEIHFCLL